MHIIRSFERTKKFLKKIETPILVIMVIVLFSRTETNDLYHILLQTIYIIMIMIVAIYAHEVGHYSAMRYYFPNAGSIRFVWAKFFLVPVPRKIKSEDLNSNVTPKQALIALFAGPIAGLTAIIILSYFLLDTYLFIVPLVIELHSARGDFGKIYITIKEEWEKKKSNQET